MKKHLSLFVALLTTTALWASNVITYTATSKLSETTSQYSSGLHTNAFNVAITSHTFANSTGTITFAGEVTRIGEGAFIECSSLTSITIPNSVTSIGERAFYDCSSLTSITIPNSVTGIGRYAFDGCTSITSVTWNAKNCNSYNFGSQVESFTFGDSVQVIPSAICEGMSKLSSITIPNSVTSIGEYAFKNCTSLTSITIPNSVKSIGNSAFFGCTSLPVENDLRYADTYLIEAVDKSLPTYTIKEGTKWIGRSAFRDCINLTSITIPNSVTSIGDEALYYCRSLTSIIIPNSVTSIGRAAFANCSKLTSITIPNSVISIGKYAFSECICLTSIAIGNSIQNIGEGTFYKCSGLTSVTIPNSVTSIGSSAFYNCTGLQSIIVERQIPPSLTSDAFKDVSHFIPLYVPDGTKSAYQAADGWKLFINIQEVTDCPYTLTIQSADNTQGTAEITTTPTSMRDAVITATANKGYAFSHWSDGNTDNPRTLKVTCDTTLVAYFTRTSLRAIITSDDFSKGYVIGGGEFDKDTTISIGALCTAEGYRFDHWSDGSTIAGRNIALVSDTTLIAYFSEDTPAECVEVSVNNPDLGSADIQIVATPMSDAKFLQWSDGNTDNPRIVTSAPGSYVAIFTSDSPTSVRETLSEEQGEAVKIIRDNQLYIQKGGKTYNAQGGEVK